MQAYLYLSHRMIYNHDKKKITWVGVKESVEQDLDGSSLRPDM